MQPRRITPNQYNNLPLSPNFASSEHKNPYQTYYREQPSTPGFVSNALNLNGQRFSEKTIQISTTFNGQPGVFRLADSAKNEKGQSVQIQRQSIPSQIPVDSYFKDVFEEKRQTEVNVYKATNPVPIKVTENKPNIPSFSQQESSVRNSLIREVYNPLKIPFNGQGSNQDNRQKTNRTDSVEIVKVEALNTAERTIMGLKNQMDNLLNEKQNLQKENHALLSENQKIKIANQSLIKDADYLKRERQKLENQISEQNDEKDTVYRQQIMDLNKSLIALNLQNKALSEKATESVNASKATREINFELENGNYELQKKITSFESQVHQLKSDNEFHSKNERNLSEIILKLRNDLSETEENRYLWENKAKQISSQFDEISSFQNELEVSKKKLEFLQKSNFESETMIKKLTEELYTKEKELETETLKTEHIESDMDKLQNEVRKLRKILDETKSCTVDLLTFENLQSKSMSLEHELSNTVTILNETRKTESEIREDYNQLRRKYQAEIENNQKNQFNMKNETQLQLVRLQERNGNLEEQNRVFQIEVNSTNQNLEAMKTEKNSFLKIKLGLETKITGLEKSAQSSAEKINLLNKQLQDLNLMNRMDSNYGQDSRLKTNELKEENSKLKRELLELKSKLIIANSENKKTLNESNFRLKSVLSANESLNDGFRQNIHQDCKKKIRELQNDYITLQTENSKLRDDVYHLREEKIMMLDRSMRSESTRNVNTNEEKEDELFDKYKALIEKAEKLKNRLVKKGFNTDNFADFETIKKISQGSFMKSQNRDGHTFPSDSFFKQTIESGPDNQLTLEFCKKEIAALIIRWNGSARQLEGKNLRELIRMLRELFDEMMKKLEENKNLNMCIEEANKMISKLECDKKILIEELRDGGQSSSHTDLLSML